MPLVRKRDTLQDLIRKTAQRRMALDEDRQDISFNLSHRRRGENEVGYSSSFVCFRVSAFFLWITEMRIVKYLRLSAILIAFVVLSTAASDGHFSLETKHAVLIMDYLVTCYYILDGFCKICSFKSYYEIMHSLSSEGLTFTDGVRRTGVADLIINILCLWYIDDHNISKWLSLLRCVLLTILFLEQMRQIDVLLVSIKAKIIFF